MRQERLHTAAKGMNQEPHTSNEYLPFQVSVQVYTTSVQLKWMSVHAEVLHDLANDLVNGQYADKERAVAMLSSMTMYIDHHEVLLEAGVLPALMSAVSNPKVEPTVSTLAAHAIS